MKPAEKLAEALMNPACLHSFLHGDYSWKIIHLENRARYMKALKAASVHKTIRTFVSCVVEEMDAAR